MYGIIFMADDEYALMVTQEGNEWPILGFQTEQKALDYFSSYHEAHERSYERSMSAALNFITFRPCVVRLPEDIEEVRDWLAVTNVQTWSNISGAMTGVLLKRDVANAQYAGGTQVSLTKEAL